MMKARATAEINLMREMREGGRGLSKAKAALETLERTFKGWERKATVNLGAQLEEVLEALLARFEPEKQFSGSEAYDIVIGELERGDG